MRKAMIFLILFSPVLFAQEKTPDREAVFEKITRGMKSQKEIKLDELEIRAKIYEPNVIYILDRTRLDLKFGEEEVLFSPRMEDPILFDEF